MLIKVQLASVLKKAKQLSKKEGKKTAFIIGNTAKFEKGGYYFTPTRITQKLITFGIIIFSGSLYLLVLTDIRLFGALTPIGGVSFIAGWIILIMKIYG